MSITPDSLFSKAAKAGASDVHIVVGYPVMFRIDGALEPQGKEEATAAKVSSFIKSVLGAEQYKKFCAEREIDASHSLSDGTRLRINCHFERGNQGLAARIIPSKIPSLEEVGLEDLKYLCDLEEGLILFTGPTGAGKSTSLAAMIDHIAKEKGGNIVTLEDPIEFVFESGKGIVRQRQCDSDFTSFPEALKRILRQDPDVIMVGEMRDLETIAATITLAETGHLVFATLHTPNAIQTVDRIVDVFPPHQQQQVRSQLSLSLRAIVAQRLLPGAKGGRIAHREVLIATPAVGNIIRESRTQELQTVIQTGKAQGMRTFEADAKNLLKTGVIDRETYDAVING